jgi:glucose-6-phosphate isomerase
MSSRVALNSWQQLSELAQQNKAIALKNLFAENEQRFEQYSLSACGLLLDYSKNLITDDIKQALLKLAEECDLEAWRDAMFAGENINRTENRAVLHSALRSELAGSDELQQQIKAELTHIAEFSTDVRSGKQCGYSGKRFTDVVCIGVGGSNLGPEMVTEALLDTERSLKVHEISSVDVNPLVNVLSTLNPETTLFIISTKTFTTAETLLNAQSAKQWLLASAPTTAVGSHFVAVTVETEAAVAFGIARENCFKIWDWVGGRFSLWSAIGLPIALAKGFDVFQALLDGAGAMDQHFNDAPLEQNMPVMLALVGIWNTTFLGMDTLAILPYDQKLHMLPAYLQQAEMESNGKSVDWQGEPIAYSTCPIVWGQTGINGQHAFYQLLHQGTHRVPADFIISLHNNGGEKYLAHHQQLVANCFAQSQALMNGVDFESVNRDLQNSGLSAEEAQALAPHKVHVGNRPSNTLLLKKLDAYHLGALIALYEQKIFVQGVIWQIYSFDQWGVQLGKVVAKDVELNLANEKKTTNYDSSTNGLINCYKRSQNSGE